MNASNELLREILAELRTINATLTAGRPAAHDAVAVADLLHAIHASIGDRVFSAGDLLIHAALPRAVDLHAKIIASIGTANARKLGKTLAQNEGHIIDGLQAIRVDSDSTGILWTVRRV